MMNYLVISVLISGLMGVFKFSVSSSHLLNSLLSLELLGVSVYTLICVASTFSGGDMLSVSLYYLTMLACESSLGLSLLVSVGHSVGSDFFSASNSVMC